MTLIFDPVNHRYYVDGKPIPGLHEILKFTGLLNDEFMWPEKARLGRYVHKAIHLLNQGKLNWNTVKEPILGFVRAYQNAQDALKFKVILSEVPLFSYNLGYACTPDGFIEIDDLGTILEIKTGQSTPIHRFQVGGQKVALEENGFKISKRYILKLNGDGTFKLDPIDFRCEFEWITIVSFYNLKLNYGV